MQRHQGVRSQRRARRCRRRSGAVDNTLTAITQTHQTNRTKHALNAGHCVATSNAGIMRASPCLTLHVLYTARAPAVWKHALNAGHCVATSNAGSMRASPCLTLHVLYTARAPAVWMGRTCKWSRGWRSVLPVRMQTRSGLMVVVCPPVIALLPTPPVA